jgi:selenoprotein W-related protein
VAELLGGWAPRIALATLRPGGGGRFEVTLDGELLFSKAALGRHAEAGEIAALVAARLGPPIDRDTFP